ncbi:nucleotidyltransferase domain-containing protein [Undibacterium sp. Ren11W]|uniref:nucleotidyltransferase domain-containing protein n=1 Tax=Undibacterium sp. Ren11W TaxID=3413045 RepID=UPI003BF24C1D
MPKLDPSALHLPARYRQILLALLRQHLPQAEVWAYGNRITDDYYEASDLDLVVRNPSDLSQASDGILDLQEALVESDIPILVQVVDWARLPGSFHAEIEIGYVVVLG